MLPSDIIIRPLACTLVRQPATPNQLSVIVQQQSISRSFEEPICPQNVLADEQKMALVNTSLFPALNKPSSQLQAPVSAMILFNTPISYVITKLQGIVAAFRCSYMIYSTYVVDPDI